MRSGNVFKRSVSMVLAFLLIFSGMSELSLKTAHAAAGAADGQIEYVGGSNSQSAVNAGYDLEISKTIEAVEGKENYFDITLTATTHKHKVVTSTDVVVVMDVSNTMNNPVAGGTIHRVEAVKTAVNYFLDNFSQNTTLSEKRFGIVTFNTNAKAVLSLDAEDAKINDWNDAYTIQQNYVKPIVAPSADDEKFTNIEAGLQLAYNMLEKSTAKYKYVILLTDGFPTTYIMNTEGNRESTTRINGYDTYMSRSYPNQSYNAGKTSEEGYFADTGRKVLNLYGVDYSDRGAKKTQAVASTIKNAGINVFSVGVALGEMSVANYLTYFLDENFNTVDTTGMTDAERAAGNYVIGNSEDSYRAWLRDSIAGGPLLDAFTAVRYLDGDNVDALKTDVGKILQAIKIAPVTTMRDFYTLDPMGENVEFLYFFDKDGNPVSGNALQGESKQNAEDTAVYGGTGNEDQINWNLIQSGYTLVNKNGMDYYVFDLTYRVRLENESAGFRWETAVATNGTTTINYHTTYEDGTSVPNGDGTLEYPVPQVEGYCGELTLVKKDKDSGAPMAGVTFTLKHEGTNCSVCSGDASITDLTGVTDADGKMTITNIPSGHEYTLVETVPSGYAPTYDHTIIVSYGKTYVDSISDAKKLVDGKLNGGSGDDFTIVNDRTEPVEVRLQIGKTVDGQTPVEGTFSFLLSGSGAYGEVVNETVTSNASGIALFSRMVFDVPGTYEYTITEVTGTDSRFIYDDTKHTVKVVVTKNETANRYEADISINGGNAKHYVGTPNVVETIKVGDFANKSRKGTELALAAVKTMEGASLAAGQYTFNICNEQGEVIRSAKNKADGSVSFEKIEYTEPGVYKYTVAEEVNSSDSAIIYDTTVYDVTVTVTAPADLKDEAPLSASVEYSKRGTAAETLTFRNAVRKPASLTLTASKTLNGVAPKDGEFTFELVQVDGGVETVIQTVTSKDGIITFDKLVYDEIKSKSLRTVAAYTYLIREKAGSSDTTHKDSIIYDADVYEVIVMVSDNHTDSYLLEVEVNKLVEGSRTHMGSVSGVDVAVGADGATAIAFDNTSKAEITLTGTKYLYDSEGQAQELTGGEFTFVIHNENGIDVFEPVTNGADGAITFGTITYTAADVGKHTYVIHEHTAEADKQPGIFYDDAVYTVEVTVSMDENGHLSVSQPVIEENGTAADSIVFENKTIDPTHLHLSATKRVNGAIPAINQVFNFELKVTEAPQGVNTDGWEQTVTNIEGRVVFKELILSVPGTYVFEVSESIPDGADESNHYTVDGMAYDVTKYTVTAVVTLSDEGELKRTVTINNGTDDVSAMIFANTYETQPVSVTLKGIKELTGRTLKDGEFSFVLKDENGEEIETVQNGVDGAYAFTEISYDAAGTYNYTVSEVAGSLGGVTYDKTVYNVKVVVNDNTKGQLEAEVTVDGAAYSDEVGEESLKFNNVYAPLPGHIILTATKVLNGRNLKAGEFEFVLEDITDAENPVEIETVTNGSAHGAEIDEIHFSPIEFTEPGIYTYSVAEVTPEAADGLGGIDYDTSVYNVTVAVEDNGEGQLIAKVDGVRTATYEMGTFTNTYDTVPASVAFYGKKSLIGTGRTLQAGDFSFVLRDSKGDEIEIVSNGADGTFTFKAIEYVEAGIYSYSVSEVIPDDAEKIPGVIYDTTERYITVVVTDNGEGTLVARVRGNRVTDGDAVSVGTIINTYKAEPVEVVLKAMKTMEGGDLPADGFSFVLKEGDKVLQTVTNAANGVICFDAIRFEQIGTFTYTVSEVIPEDNEKLDGVIYDNTEYTVVVEVTDDGSGQLKADVEVNGAVYDDEKIVFVNKHAPGYASVELEALKILNGRTLQAGEFSFVLTDITDSDNPRQVGNLATNDADGNIVFKVEIDKAGTYTYTISEVKGNDSNVIYDTAEYTVTVKVEDDGTGKLKIAEIVYSSDTIPVFENVYEPTSISIVLEGRKTLLGRQMNAGEFKFEVRNDNGNVLATGTNDENGNINFSAFELSDYGIYNLTVVEADTGVDHVIYDLEPRDVVVKVADSQGRMVFSVIYPEGGLQFVNTYDENYVPGDPASPEGGEVVDTGDHTMMALWAALSGLSGTVAVGTAGIRISFHKRRRNAHRNREN